MSRRKSSFVGVFDTVRFPDWVREVVEDSTIPVGEIALTEFFKKGDGYWMDGEEMLKRAKALGPLPGYRQALYLRGHPERLPEGTEGRWLIFLGTSVVDEDGGRCVPSLLCGGGLSVLSWARLEDGFRRDCCLAVPRLPAGALAQAGA